MKFVFAFFVLVSYCLSGWSQQLVRGPYLQQPTSGGVTIRWRTDVATDTRVQYYASSAPSQVFSVAEPTLTTEHSVTLTGLADDTRFFYGVGTSQRTLAQTPDHFFITSPLPTTRRPVRFWAMGDFGAANTAMYTSNQQTVRDQFLAFQKAHTDLWVWLGDNAYCCGTQEEYQTQIFDFYGAEVLGNIPILPSPGNHEYYATPTATEQQDRNIPYYDIITAPTQAEAGGVPSGSEAYYAVNYGNVHFISLDSYGFDEGKYPLYDKNSAQYQWLEKDLAANKQLWTVVFFHHPPYTKRSHDSDVEAALIELRKTLVPLFDHYKVDLVLNGHSHVYERSYLMKEHTGNSSTFNKAIHVVQQTAGRYTKDSPPIINKDEGTIYMVVGSAGRLDWNRQPQAHPSSVYANYEIGGSALFTVDENRLDARWLCADGQIRDSFTVFKNVNKKSRQSVVYGASLELKASWKGTYRWSTGQVNQASIALFPQSDMLVTVQDSLGYLADSFLVSVAKPVLTTRFDTSQVRCAGQVVNVDFSLSGPAVGQTYRAELSDSNGQFLNPTALGEGLESPIRGLIPATVKEGWGYRMRVVSVSGALEGIPSAAFGIGRPAEARFTSPSPQPYAPSVALSMELKGSLPAQLRITSLPLQPITQPTVSVTVNPAQENIFRIEEVSNRCGTGIADTRAIEIARPLASSPLANEFLIYPNPGSEYILLENANFVNTPIQVVITTMSGKSVPTTTLNFSNKDRVSIQELPAGTYVVEVQAGTWKWQKRIVKH